MTTITDAELDALEALEAKARPPFEVQPLAVALALGTTTIRDEGGRVEQWRIDRFMPIAEFFVSVGNNAKRLIAALREARKDRECGPCEEWESMAGVQAVSRIPFRWCPFCGGRVKS